MHSGTYIGNNNLIAEVPDYLLSSYFVDSNVADKISIIIPVTVILSIKKEYKV